MFSFFKSSPYLKDFLDGNFVDIHSHLLPNIDDGAKTINNTISLLKSMREIGISHFITTPHISHYVWDNSEEKINLKFDETKLILENESIKIPLKVAAEYFIDDWFENHFQTEPLLTLKDNYVLVEISYINPPVQLYKVLFDLQIAGYNPILAHPERYLFYHKNFDEFYKLKKAGCKFQLNLLSIVGYYGTQVNKTANELLKQGLYDFVGTDIHHSKHLESFSKKVTVSESSILKEIIENNQFFKF